MIAVIIPDHDRHLVLAIVNKIHLKKNPVSRYLLDLRRRDSYLIWSRIRSSSYPCNDFQLFLIQTTFIGDIT